MHDELQELAKKHEKARKTFKETCMRQEKTVVEAEMMAEKSKAKYHQHCEDMEKLKDPNKHKFGFKSKSNPQHEQELQSKITNAEADYRQRVSLVQNLRKELEISLRPQYAKDLKDRILECDAGLSVQLSKYAALNESLALNGGFIVSPLKTAGVSNGSLSLKDIAAKVDNELDFYNDIVKVEATKKQMNRPEMHFVQHPYMAATMPDLNTLVASTPETYRVNTPVQVIRHASPTRSVIDRASVTASPVSSHYFQDDLAKSKVYDFTNMGREINPMSPNYFVQPPRSPVSASSRPFTGYVLPSFGTSLDEIIEHEALPEPIPVPRVVSQCIAAIDMYGLDMEGIYRHAGNPSQVQVLKHMFDTDPMSVDLSKPARYGINDIHAVSGTLKLYFQELPDPLLTQQYHADFIEAAKIDNDWKRRDVIHEIVNRLADSNYTVLRYLIFHLDRVSRHEAMNRMAVINLGNMWGSVLMASRNDNITEMALQARVVETILYNCDHMFESE